MAGMRHCPYEKPQPVIDPGTKPFWDAARDASPGDPAMPGLREAPFLSPRIVPPLPFRDLEWV